MKVVSTSAQVNASHVPKESGIQPIWDRAHTYCDAFITYRTKIFADKVGFSLQLNARNVTEGGRLQPISAEADGRINAFRIVDPRLFILTATFNL